VAALLFGGILTFTTSAAPAPALTELQVRAAFLLNFAAFVEWPPEAFSSDAAPIVIGTYGVEPFGDLLDRMLDGETIRGRPLAVRRFEAGAKPEDCHILYVAQSERRNLARVMPHVRESPVLTVSGVDNFTAHGGIIQLVTDRGRIRFKINQSAAQKVGLVLSSKLLRLAQNDRS
jgi:hypothetical protein